MTEATTLPATLREWVAQQFDADQLRDIAIHGCVAGVPGLIYYSDTVELYTQFHDEIWDHLYYAAQDYGYDNVFEMLANFKMATVGTHDQFCNLLVWYMAETVARELVDSGELSEENE